MNNKTARNCAKDILRCPSCGSRHTQTLPALFSFGARPFRRDGNTDALPESVEPPQRRSEVLVPAVFGALSSSFTHLAVLVISTELGAGWLSAGGIFDWRIFAPAVLVGITVCATLIVNAVSWNLRELPNRLEEWHRTAVCRRCFTQFLIPKSAASKPREKK